jgi:hypothetical protein
MTDWFREPAPRYLSIFSEWSPPDRFTCKEYPSCPLCSPPAAAQFAEPVLNEVKGDRRKTEGGRPVFETGGLGDGVFLKRRKTGGGLAVRPMEDRTKSVSRSGLLRPRSSVLGHERSEFSGATRVERMEFMESVDSLLSTPSRGWM